jgi:hypothetical protein
MRQNEGLLSCAGALCDGCKVKYSCRRVRLERRMSRLRSSPAALPRKNIGPLMMVVRDPVELLIR